MLIEKGREKKDDRHDRMPLQFRVNGYICKLMTSGAASKLEFNVANEKPAARLLPALAF